MVFINVVFDRKHDVFDRKHSVFDRKHRCFRSKTSLTSRSRPIKKLKVMNHRWMKLVHHNGPNHPAKYGCLGVRSYKVGFSLVNRVSLIFKVRAAGFLPGVLLFSDLSFEKFSPGFYFFPKSKNSFAGSYYFLEFSHIVCCFLPFSVYLKAKTLKKIRLRRAGSYCFSKFSASGGVLLFSKIHKKIASRGFIFSENSQNLPSGVLRRGGF